MGGFDCGRLKTCILRTNRGLFVLEALLPVGCEERAGGNLSQENHHHHHQYLPNPNHHHRHHRHHLCRQGAEDSQRPRLWGNGHCPIATCALFVRFSHYLILCIGRVISKFEFRETSISERRARDLLLEMNSVKKRLCHCSLLRPRCHLGKIIYCY